jgi:phospholipid-binding lipoprotein MlaA
MTYGACTRASLRILAAGLFVGIAVGVAGRPIPAVAASPLAMDDPLFDEDRDEGDAGYPDPLEPINRYTFRFNRQVDRWVFEPVTRFYRFLVPAPARRAVRRVFVNLDAPVTIVNDVLQLEPRDAAVTAVRFVINTTAGIGGLFDVAADFADLEGHESDFGQTLALSGVPTGPYLIVPILGPNSTRDATGYLVDILFRPTTYLLTPGGTVFISGFVNPGSELLFTTLLEGSTELAEGIATREASGQALAALEASSVDYYAALRNAYYQNRMSIIWRRGPDRGPLARAKWALAALSLGPSGGKVGDLRADGGGERVEAAALEH